MGTSAHSHPISTMVHTMRERQSTSGTTQTNRAHHRRQRTPSNTMRLSHVERRCGLQWTESAEHVCENIWVRHAHRCRMKGPTDTFATMWAVKMLNFFGLSDVILHGDPEPSLIKLAESVKSKTIRTNSHSKLSQTVTSEQRRS